MVPPVFGAPEAPPAPEMKLEGEISVRRRDRVEEPSPEEPESEPEPSQPEPERDPRLWSMPRGSSSPPPGSASPTPLPSVT